jgi:hypothetical protein
LKLGKLAPKFNKKTLTAAMFMAADALPVAPTKNYWEYKVPSFPMMLNDNLGSCVFASGGHLLQNWTAHTGKMVTPADADVLAAYEAVGGYVPGNPSTDNGAAITDFLNWWQENGFVGHKILGWASVDQTNLQRVRQAVFAFGALNIGIQFPNVAMQQFSAGMPWDVVDDDGGIDGGHCIPILGQGSQGFACITWGKIQYMTNAFFEKYCDESYAVVTQDWLDAAGTTPIAGLDLEALNAALAEIKA